MLRATGLDVLQDV